jgi:hypothetical protein
MTPAAKKYLSDIMKSKRVPDNSDPANPKEYHEIVVNFNDARRVWLSISTPDVKNSANQTQLQVVVRDNATNKTLVMIGTAMVPAGYVLPIFAGALVNNKTLIFRAADEISLLYEARLDD